MFRKSLILLVTACACIFLACREQTPLTPPSNTAPVVAAPEKSAVAIERVPEFPGADGFVREIDNPYIAFERGKVFRYEGDTPDGHERVVVEVTNKSKRILGVRTTVVHDRAYLDGELIEDTIDWYAQDEAGNVWYFGEAAKQIQGGQVVGTEGSWEAGVDGAEPGIFMLARPRVGDQYRQEFAVDVAEDEARVVSLDERVRVPYGRFDDCLQTVEWTRLDPGKQEFKYYARGVGQVLTLEDESRIELVSVRVRDDD